MQDWAFPTYLLYNAVFTDGPYHLLQEGGGANSKERAN